MPMATRGNKNWNNPEQLAVPSSSPTSFDQMVKQLGLSPDQYESSAVLKEWVRKNKDVKYVPTALLQAWGFKVDSNL